LIDEVWPALFARRHMKAEVLEPELLTALWQDKIKDEFAEASIIGTAAVALKLLGKAESQAQAHALAEQFWSQRNRENMLN
jgi:anthranilate phosphoribosyltransferase